MAASILSFNRPSLVLCAAFGAALVACGDTAPKRPEPVGDPIAVVGKEKLTVEEIQRRLDEQSPFVRARYADDAKKKEFLDNQVKFEVLAQEAFARGFDEDPEVRASIKKVIVQKLTREEFDNRVKATDITDAELRTYYEGHKADYDKPEQVRASIIVFGFGKDKAAAQKLAADVHKKAADKGTLEDRNAFRELVAAHSTDDGTKRAGGDIRYVSREDALSMYGDAAAQWLFGAETINEVGPVFETKDAFVILKRTGKRKAITRNFDQVKNQIRNVVFREKRQASFDSYVDELKKKHGVQVFDEKLAKVKVSAEVPTGMMPPSGDGHDHGGMPSDGIHGGMGGAGGAGVEDGDEGGAMAPSGPLPVPAGAPGAPGARAGATGAQP